MAPRALGRHGPAHLRYLAKPVAVVGVVPLLALMWSASAPDEACGLGAGRPAVIPLLILWLYTGAWPARRVALASASRTTRRACARGSVDERLRLALSVAAVRHGAGDVPRDDVGRYGFCWRSRSGGMLTGGAGSHADADRRVAPGGPRLYLRRVTVERVDYYMLLLLPPLALLGGARSPMRRRASAARMSPRRAGQPERRPLRFCPRVAQSRAAIAPYYRYNKSVYRRRSRSTEY